MSSNLPARPSRPRHLMDPEHLVRPVNDQSITTVQRWVMTALVMTVAFLLAIGWVVIAGTIVEKTAAQVVLLVNAAAFGVIGVLAGRVIHQKRMLSLWLALGFVPSIVGAWWVLR